MRFLKSAVRLSSRSRRASAIDMASRSVIEPLESRTLLSGHGVTDVMGPADAMSSKVATPSIVISAPSTKPGVTVNGLSNPAPSADAMTPSQLRQAYGFNFALPNGTSAEGAGETIALVEGGHDSTIQNDLHVFDQQYFGGVDPSFTQINLGSNTMTGDPIETALDVEWAHAMAPQANILLVEAKSMAWTDLLAGVDKAVSMGAQVVSMSWGSAEFSGETAYDSHFTAPNVTFVASSGDSGAPGEYPAASPYVLGVGGTSVQLDANNNVFSESGWVDTGSSSGGSVSAYEPRPAYQPATYSNGTTTGIALTGRGVPDVSYDADADNGVSVYDSAVGVGWYRVGGTSCGAPQWASIAALADQVRAQNGLSALGTADVHAALYANPADLRDITVGTSTGTPNYTAGTGYDLVTGLGSPQVPLVVSTLAGSTAAVPATPPSVWAIPGNGQVSVAWDGSIGATAYNVYRSTDGTTFNLDASVSGTSFVDQSLSNGVSYWYQVTAANTAGESAAGAAVSAVPQIAPAAPTRLSATPVNAAASVSLQWTVTPGVGQYVVKRAKFSGGPWVVIASNVQATSFTDVDASYSHTYYYAVSAVTAGGEESVNSNVVSATVVPAAPTNLTATAGNAQVALAWSASTGATSYEIFRSTTKGSGYTLIASVTGTSYTNTRLTNGTTYYYVVQAVDAGGPSANSNQASATPSRYA